MLHLNGQHPFKSLSFTVSWMVNLLRATPSRDIAGGRAPCLTVAPGMRVKNLVELCPQPLAQTLCPAS